MKVVSRVLPLAVAGLTCLPFLPSLSGSFLMWDDQVNFLANQAYRGLGWSNIRWMFTTTLLAVYTPLAWLSLGMNYALGGMDPWGYHLVNVLLHAGNAALLFLLARRLLGAPYTQAPEVAVLAGATVAALAFGVHPLRVESVAWITERRDVLCGWFYLLSVLAYVRAVSGQAGRTRWLAASVAAFGAALLSKGIAMTLPVSLLVLDAYPLARSRLGWRALLREKVPFACLALPAAAVAYAAAGQGSAWTGYEQYGLGARIGMIGYSAWFYPWKMAWPYPLLPLYELPVRVDLFAPEFLAPTLTALTVTVVLVALRRRVPGALAAWGHSLIVVAPVSGVIHAGNQLAHDRWSYLSGLGFALLAGAGVAWTMTAWKDGRLRTPLASLVLATAALALVGWGAGSWRQSTVWQSSESLWRRRGPGRSRLRQLPYQPRSGAGQGGAGARRPAHRGCRGAVPGRRSACGRTGWMPTTTSARSSPASGGTPRRSTCSWRCAGVGRTPPKGRSDSGWCGSIRGAWTKPCRSFARRYSWAPTFRFPRGELARALATLGRAAAGGAAIRRRGGEFSGVDSPRSQ